MIRSDHFTSAALRISDLALGVRHDQVLNNGSAGTAESDIASRLMQTSKALLSEGIDLETGLVNYEAIQRSSTYAQFHELSSTLTHIRINDLGDGPEYTAFWINIYNALIIDAIIQFDIRGSIMRRPGIFRQAAYEINGMRFSADDIEHGILRQNRPNPVLPFRPFSTDDPRLVYMVADFDPRIHFALVCGAMSCPPISHYSAEKLDFQLDQAASSFINGGDVTWDATSNTLWLSRIFDWYEGDFGGRKGVIDLLRQHSRDENVRNLSLSDRFRVRYKPYDWGVNKVIGSNIEGFI